MNPGLVILKEFCLETVMMRCLDDRMDFWLGGQQKDASRSIRRVRGRLMCGLGVLVGLVDDRMLRGAKIKVARTFLPRRPRSRMRSVSDYRT